LGCNKEIRREGFPEFGHGRVNEWKGEMSGRINGEMREGMGEEMRRKWAEERMG
jgi:hypothetical protein